ncbi:hypothetical protein ACFL2Q_11525 [Thermodesulfobacteriota bacterium]
MKTIFFALIVLVIGAFAMVSVADSPTLQGFDRENCLFMCDLDYGGGSDGAHGRFYARCIEECERKSDAEFDRKIKELEDEPDD